MRDAVLNFIGCFLKLCIISSALVDCCSMKLPDRCDVLEKETKCSGSDILKNIQFTPISSGDINISSNGTFEVNFTMPSLHCCYKIHVLVNKSVTEDACENYTFTDYDVYNDKLLHSEINICFEHHNYSGISSCQRPISRKIDNLFTGCYGLRYQTFVETTVSKSMYIASDYNEREIEEPKSSCYYSVTKNDDKNTDRHVDFQFTAEFPDDVRIWKFNVDITGMRSRDCFFESKYTPQYIMYMDNSSTYENYCNVDPLKNGTGKRNVDCTFKIAVPQNMNFSTILKFMDNRCAKHSLWNPTTCTWKFTDCEDTSERLTTTVPQVETIKKHNYLSFCISISLLLGCAFLMSVYHLKSRHIDTTQYQRTNANEDNGTAKSDKNITEIQNINIVPKNYDKSNGVILLYVKSSSSFLKFMADFGKILKRCCHCDVHDWYGVDELEAAKLGPFDWVNKLRKTGCRIVWVDTPFSRSLVLSHSEENYQKKLLLCGDFRDEAFPVILNMAKHCINDPTSLYENHFIIRFDALPVHDDADDPFADISPHARYTMPRHFNQLCLDLSGQVSGMENNTFEVIDTKSEIKEELQRLMNTLQNF